MVIPSYNHAPFLREAIESVLAQTYNNLEIIIYDDGSTDGSQDIIADLARSHSNILPIYARDNHGISFAINAGLERCDGEYVVIFDCDDVMLPNKLRTQVSILERHPDCGICSHDEDFIDENGKVIGLLTAGRPLRGGVELLFQTRWFLGQYYRTQKSSYLARYKFMLASKYDLRLRVCNEWLHMIDCLAITGLRWIHTMEILGRYRKYKEQTSQNPEFRKIDFEEQMLVLTLAGMRYPHFSGLIKNRRDFLLFERLLFGWHSPNVRGHLERQFLREAGISKWLYLKLARTILYSPGLMNTTRPVRIMVRRILAQRGDNESHEEP